RTGQPRSFTQANGSITISGQTTWNPYDTVFKVQTNGRQGINRSLTASATSSATGHAASALVDNDFQTYWGSDTKVPVTITLDQGSAKKVRDLAVNQREWSPTHPRSHFGGNQDSARIKGYRVEVSGNGSTWTTAASGTLPSQRGVQTIDLGGVSTRYVRIVVSSTWSGSQASNYYKKLRIDEMWLGSGWAGGGGTPPSGETDPAGGAHP